MKRLSLILVALVVAVAVAMPVMGRDWIEKPLLSASERVLTTMPADFYQIDPKALERLMETAKPFVLDVREPAEWQADRIAGAVHIPLRDLARNVGKLPENKSTPIVTYCAIGYRGGISMTVLRMWGYTNVRTLKGGLNGWKAAGLPVTK
ncbi:MAG: rhodanese-like domain-containing protein [Armatimonadetes bacterium]|nr:rhodanese-like domain-containing protein [Armatimonadota bacterium]